MFIIYDLIALVFTLIFFPVYLFKGKFHRGFLARLGVLPENLILDRPIWIHAVSLGEAISIRTLVEGLRKVYPAKKFVISTVTPTGNKIAKTLAREGDFVTYLPLDFSFIVAKVVKRVNPGIFIIVETEIWPNLISRLYKENIPVVTVNARISDGSFKGYSRAIFLARPVLNKISLFCAQTGSDAARLKSLGAQASKIKVTGNMKFDQLIPVSPGGYKEKLGINFGDKLFVVGSTHPGEEEMILGAYRELLNKIPGLKLLIAPRHTQRSGDISKLASSFGFQGLEISRLNSGKPPYPDNTVFILDTVGELVNFYAAADIVFIGGSLVKKGGHNILEPAGAGKPVIFGPHMFNFRDITGMFLKNNAAAMVKTKEDLVSIAGELLKNNSKALQLVNNAKKVITENQGATAMNIEAIRVVYGNIRVKVNLNDGN
jgi:3-deoxy-D-manno-octulosonic-acid transferase